MGELRFELHCEWSVTCVWIMEGMVWEVVWKGWKLKEVDGVQIVFKSGNKQIMDR